MKWWKPSLPQVQWVLTYLPNGRTVIIVIMAGISCVLTLTRHCSQLLPVPIHWIATQPQEALSIIIIYIWGYWDTEMWGCLSRSQMWKISSDFLKHECLVFNAHFLSCTCGGQVFLFYYLLIYQSDKRLLVKFSRSQTGPWTFLPKSVSSILFSLCFHVVPGTNTTLGTLASWTLSSSFYTAANPINGKPNRTSCTFSFWYSFSF